MLLFAKINLALGRKFYQASYTKDMETVIMFIDLMKTFDTVA